MAMIKKFRYEILFFVLFVLVRLPFLGQEMFNTDTWKWKARIYDFGSGVFNLDFDKTLQKYHPGVTLMWVGTAAVKFQGLYCSIVTCPDEAVDPVGAVFTLHYLQKLFVVLAIGITLALAFYPLRKLFGKKYAFIALSLISFEPFFYALTRVIHLEALMSSFMLTSFVWLVYALETAKGEKRPVKFVELTISAVFAGLSILTKSTAIFMIPVSILSIIFYHKKNIRSVAKLSLLWFLGVVVIYFILWPAMWVHPITTLDYVFIRGIKETGLEGEHAQIYLGTYTENPGPFYYLVVAGYKFSPILVTGILLFVLFFKKVLQHFGGEKARRFALLSLVFTVGYLTEITIPSKKLDRYILPALTSFSLLAGFFYTWFVFKLSTLLGLGPSPAEAGRPDPRMVRKLVLPTLFLVAIAYQSLSLSPDYFSYYSPLMGGLAKGIYALEPKWIIGQHQVANYFADLMKEKNLEPFKPGESFDNQKDLSHKLTVAFPEKYYTQIWPFIRKIGGWASIEDLSPNARKTTYFVYPVWDDYSAKETRFTITYIDSIYLRGVKLYNVYERHGI